MNEAQEKHDELKAVAFEKLREAERAMYEYFCSCELGKERMRAGMVYENIRMSSCIPGD